MNVSNEGWSFIPYSNNAEKEEKHSWSLKPPGLPVSSSWTSKESVLLSNYTNELCSLIEYVVGTSMLKDMSYIFGSSSNLLANQMMQEMKLLLLKPGAFPATASS